MWGQNCRSEWGSERIIEFRRDPSRCNVRYRSEEVTGAYSQSPHAGKGHTIDNNGGRPGESI